MINIWRFAAISMLCLTGQIQSSAAADPPTRLVLGFEKPGVTIDFVNRNPGLAPAISFDVVIHTGSHAKKAATLADLENSVTIQSPQSALKYVRLLTSPSTELLWAREYTQFEVVRRKEWERLPTFGTGSHEGLLYENSSGHDGFLSDDAFREGGFSPATAAVHGDSFQVTRWLFSLDTGPHRPREPMRMELLKVREYVGRSGSYRRVILQKRHLPHLRDTVWRGPMLY
jgi:hypothetical protein